MLNSLTKLFSRDLIRLKGEVESFDENSLWVVTGDVKNSAGNLTMHLCGNLQHYIGAILANTGYIRNREHEFNCKGLSTKELIKEIEISHDVVISAFDKLKKENKELSDNYPINVFGEEMSTEYFLIHLHSHLNYHLGQINYLRRITNS